MLTVADAGIDTWSPSWYVPQDSSAAAAMTALATVKTARGSRIPEPVMGHVVGWFPASGLVYAEGHPAEGALGAGDGLMDVLGRLETAIQDLGISIDTRERPFDSLGSSSAGRAGVRRMDCTVDVITSSAYGGALLSGIAAIDPGRLDVQTRRGPRGLETVSWMGARGLVARAYDKGVESGTNARGERTRLEAQYRWAQESRRAVDELTSSYVRDKFVARFHPLWRASKGIKVVGAVGIVDELKSRVERGELTTVQAEQALAFQLLGSAGDGLYTARTRRRRRALVQETGLVLHNGAMEEVEVDLHEVLEEVLDTDAWGRSG
jgi:hypothetical protein